ncbi:hypothetical protein [Nonomuraea jabiensis]
MEERTFQKLGNLMVTKQLGGTADEADLRRELPGAGDLLGCRQQVGAAHH